MATELGAVVILPFSGPVTGRFSKRRIERNHEQIAGAVRIRAKDQQPLAQFFTG
jgi:hypothetical protein